VTASPARALVALLRHAFPHTTIRVRLDGGFAHPELLNALDRWGVDYLVAMVENAVLTRHVAPLMPAVRAEVDTTAATAHVYGDTWYRAKSWPYERRVIMKAQVVALDGKAPRDNPRFTNLRQSPRWIYETV